MLDERLSMQQLSGLEFKSKLLFILIVMIILSATDEDRQISSFFK